MHYLKQKIDQFLEATLVFLMAFMVINVSWQVASRYLLQSPSSFTEELARYLLIWIGLLGSAYAVGQGTHLAIDILSSKLSTNRNKILQQIIYLLILLFAVLIMIVGGGRLVYITFYLGQNSAVLRVPLGYIYSVLPLSGFLITFYCSYNIFLKPQINQDSAVN